jgi:hypothetical protein
VEILHLQLKKSTYKIQKFHHILSFRLYQQGIVDLTSPPPYSGAESWILTWENSTDYKKKKKKKKAILCQQDCMRTLLQQ